MSVLGAVIVSTAKRSPNLVNMDGEDINTAESFFALLNRGHYGVFRSLSKNHLFRYCNEFIILGKKPKKKTEDVVKGAEKKPKEKDQNGDVLIWIPR